MTFRNPRHDPDAASLADNRSPAGDLQAAALASIVNAVVITDADGTIRWVNRAFTDMSGYASEEVVGSTPRLLKSGLQDDGFYGELWSTVLAGRPWRGQLVNRHRSGRLYRVVQTITPILGPDGVPAHFVAVHEDVTELWDAREQAQRRASQQAAVAGFSRRALTELDLDQLCNDAIKTVTVELDVPLVAIVEPTAGGLLVRGGIGQTIEQVDALSVSGNDPSLASYTLIEGDTVVVDELAAETRFEPSVGLRELGVVSAVCTPVHGWEGNHGALTALTTTHRRFTDDDIAFLEAVAAALGSAINRGHIEAELQATATRLAHSDDIRMAFLRATSHELRTPLAAVMGFAETLKDHHDQLAHDQLQVVFERLHANAGRLGRLIEDLLDVDRLASGLVTADLQSHDLTALIRRVADDQDLAGHHLELDLEAVEADVDPPKLERVVANLLANAVRHSPPGGTVTVRLRHAAGMTVLAVEDEGSGIDPDYLDEIFEPFVQGPDRHQAAQPGTGLGLTLARDLVHLHGGRISAANLDHGGARIEVTLPATPRGPGTP